jgi:hypothetical protein
MPSAWFTAVMRLWKRRLWKYKKKTGLLLLQAVHNSIRMREFFGTVKLGAGQYEQPFKKTDDR